MQREPSRCDTVAYVPAESRAKLMPYMSSSDVKLAAHRRPRKPWTNLLYIASTSCHAPSLLATVL